jgi:hypothetical protein
LPVALSFRCAVHLAGQSDYGQGGRAAKAKPLILRMAKAPVTPSRHQGYHNPFLKRRPCSAVLFFAVRPLSAKAEDEADKKPTDQSPGVPACSRFTREGTTCTHGAARPSARIPPSTTSQAVIEAPYGRTKNRLTSLNRAASRARRSPQSQRQRRCRRRAVIPRIAATRVPGPWTPLRFHFEITEGETK